MRKQLLALILFLSTLTYAQTAVEPSNFREQKAGTYSNPYKIANLGNLYWIALDTTRWNKYYIQTANINASAVKTWNVNTGWMPLGNEVTRFTGDYEGNGHIIDSLYINRSAFNQGFFGFTERATIKNVGLSNIDITNHWDKTGGLVGYNKYSQIIQCFSSGSVHGNSYVGGLVGFNEFSYISYSYSSCRVVGNSYIGGLIGLVSSYYHIDSYTDHCYSSGKVEGMYYKGGLMGGSGLNENYDGSIISECYWDNTVNSFDNYIGIGKTSEEMKSYSTYNSTEWNFSYMWGIDETGKQNKGYPFLRWQGYTHVLKPVFATQPVTDISAATALGHGSIEFLGYPLPSQYGLCWSTSENPTINNNKTIHTPVSIITFNSSITGFLTNTTYYARAYIISTADTFYANQVSFVYNGFEGAGTDQMPYLIQSPDDLKYLADSTALWDKSFKQTAEINVSVTKTWNNGEGWKTIGSNPQPFTGKYDGQGFSIDSLIINRPDSSYQGLFGKALNSTITNVNLTNVNIAGGDYTGGLAGTSVSSSIINCSSSGSISTGSFSGGLVGVTDSSTIYNCSSTAYLSGTSNTGLLIGYSYNSTTTSSYTNGNVSGTTSTGGLIGNAEGSIVSSSYSSTTVNGDSYIGGLIGETHNADVNNCYSDSSVHGNLIVGGLTGYDVSSTISNCYTIGSVSGRMYTGGISGLGSTVNNCFWNKTVNPDLDNGFGTGKTTYELKTHSTYVNAGWDFLNETSNGSENYWGINETGAEHEGYPFLQWQGFSDFLITDETPYLIRSLNDLKYISENSPLWDKIFKQVVNISAASVSSWNENTGFGPIGNDTIQFTGKYDGNGYIIDSLSINRSDSSHQGFFGKTNGCTLVKLRLTNVSITGNDNIGGLVGENVASSISECFTNGKITGSESVGGLIGKNLSSSINQSSSSAEVTGGSYTGGLVGSNDSSPINGCRSDAEVTGTVYTGLLVGYSYASTITHSYAYGNVHAGPRTGG
ncbi:MAG: hypothetical protein R6W90_11925, partial [Ignavibacteriaceae bacterium]